MKDLEPAEPVRRYEYADPGGLIHIAIKKLGRFDREGCHCGASVVTTPGAVATEKGS